MKTILCAVDFSTSAIFALKYAAELCKKTNTSLFVINIYNYSTFAASIKEPNFLTDKEITAKKTAELELFCKQHLLQDFEKTNCKIKAIEGVSVVDQINKKAQLLNAFLIIVGMKGINKFKDFFIGTTTKKLIEKAICPVLAIPNEFEEYNFKTFVYATDFEKEDIFAIKELAQLAEKLNSTIKVVHIANENNNKAFDEMEWFKELVNQKVTYKKLKFKLLFSDDILNTLHEYIEENNAHIIAMLERKKVGFLNDFLHGDLVKKFESYINIPLLSFREENY
ncbi:universal stress protein [Lutibacter sp.]|uniref:universal stress protein n=1 Tax=Lutibacter sp. TaxID=1925666 RepID=UPI003562A242